MRSDRLILLKAERVPSHFSLLPSLPIITLLGISTYVAPLVCFFRDLGGLRQVCIGSGRKLSQGAAGAPSVAYRTDKSTELFYLLPRQPSDAFTTPRSGGAFSAPSSARSWCSARSATAWHLRVGCEREHTGATTGEIAAFSCNLALCSWNVLAPRRIFSDKQPKAPSRERGLLAARSKCAAVSDTSNRFAQQ